MKSLKKVLLTVFLLAVLFIPAYKVSAEDSTVIDSDTGSAVSEMETKVYEVTDTSITAESLKYYQLNITAGAELVVPIQINEAGKLTGGAGLHEEMSGVVLDYGFYTDKECTDEIYIYDNLYYPIPKAATYYFKCKISDSNATPQVSYKADFGSVLVSSEDKTLESNKAIYSAFSDYNDPIYYKVIVTKAGVINFNIKSEYSQKVTLCNSNKKAISDECYSSEKESFFFFGTDKGTYYVKVCTSSSYAHVKYSIDAIKDGGSKKAKATKITVNSKRPKTGFIVAADKTSKVDWYKFVNPKKQPINLITYGYISSGEIEVEVLDAAGNSFGTFYMSPFRPDRAVTIYNGYYSEAKKTLLKGTYYIKVKKSKAKTLAGYELFITNQENKK